MPNKSSLIEYAFAGAMLRNSVPHFVIGITDRRNITPFGRDSSPGVNVLWGTINFVGGCLLVRHADQATGRGKQPWPAALEVGGFLMSLFMVGYRLTHPPETEGEQAAHHAA